MASPRAEPDRGGRAGRSGRSEPIAVIGLGCVFPGSFDPRAYFRHILQGKCFVRPLPPDRLDPTIWYDPDRQAPVASYTRLGAWVDGFVFDPVPFRIPPRVAARLDLTQQLALVAARQALAAAGLLEGDFDHDRTAVIIGNSMGGVASVDNLRAIHFHEFLTRGRQAGLLPSDDTFARQYQELIRPAPITEDSLPGELSSLVAGRISAVFDLHGPNFTVDAACGSGLAAVIAGVDALRQGRVDLVLAGGADTQMDPGSFVKFSKVTALSATGSFPFDARGDGFIMGEGAGLVVLERLSDARRLGHPVLAVIYGVGQASDGKGKGITAPNPAGQRRALERAWADAGLSPRAATYFEAHGTGTVVGDAIELRALADFLREAPPLDPALAVEAGAPVALPGAAAASAEALETRPAVGSVKAMIGHAKAAAGAAGLLKAILCCNRRVIPPQPNFERLPDSLAAEALPFSIPQRGYRFGGRRYVAGVSSFGFGGTDHHVVLGEPVDGPVAPFDLGDDLEALLAMPPNLTGVAPDATVPEISSPGQAPSGRAETQTGSASGGRGEAGPAAQAHPSDSRSAGAVDPATIAVVFPGQGSQYLRMLAAWRDEPPFAAVLEVAEEVFRTVNGESLREAIYPPVGLGADEEERRSLLLQSTLYAQPAMFAVSAGLLEVVRARGLRFGMAFGHSLGEYTALYAAGILPLRSALQAVCLRGRYMNAIPGDDLGAMAVVGLPAAAVREGLEGIPGYLICSNLNSPTQTVLSGATAAIEAAVRRFEARGVLARRLPVSAAFHSEMVAPAVPLFAETLAGLEIGEGSVPVPANVTGAWYPSRAGPPREGGGDPRQEVIRLLTTQAVSPVDFIGQVERAWAAGIRTFVEVGPKHVLGRLIAEILAGRPHTCLMLDQPRQDGRALVRQALVALGVERPSTSAAAGARRSSSVGDRPGTNLATPAAAVRGGSRPSEGEGVAAAADRAPATQVAGGPSGRSAATEASSSGRSVFGPDDAGSTASRSAAGAVGAVDPSSVDPSSVETIVRETIAMISGYPAAMIQPDLDLEADLGIDTLKIFEIGSRLREAFPALGQGRLELGRLRTARRLVELIVERSVAAPLAVAEAAGSAAVHGPARWMPGPTPAAEAVAPAMIGRYGVSWRRFPALSASAGSTALFAPGERVVVKTAGAPAFEQALRHDLAERGLSVHLWTPEEADLEQLEAGQTPAGLQAARHYVHLLPRARFGRKTRKRFYREEILSLFMVARRLGRTSRSLIVLTDLGGEPPPANPDPARPDFLRGVLSGFLASAGKDFPGLAVRGLDLPAFAPATVPAALAALQALAGTPSSPVVVGLPAADEWAAEAVEPQPLDITPEAVLAGLRGCLGPTTTILATGGGGGILRPLLRCLAREFHCRIVVLGRAPDRHDLLAELRMAGGEAAYLPCNLADGPAVDRTGEIIRRLYPRIDVLIHAAGLESSRNLANKTPAEIDEIYRVKVAGLVNLLEAIGEERIGLVVNFSSVASLFGNPGQADYAAANGFLNHYRGSGRTRFWTIAWTAWAGAGMAARGPIAEILRANQVDFIAPAVGERLFLQELHQALVADPAPARTVAYFGRLGANLAPIGMAGGVREQATTSAAGPEPASGQAAPSSDEGLAKLETGPQPISKRESPGSTIPRQLGIAPAGEARPADASGASDGRDDGSEERTLTVPATTAPESLTLLVDPQRAPWVLDHAIGGRAILPAVVSLDAVWSEQVQGLPSLPTSLKMSQVVFHAPVKFTAEETVHLWAEPADGRIALWAQVKPEHGRPPRHHLTCAIEPAGLDAADRRRLVEGERKARFRLEEEAGEVRLTRRCLSRAETYRVLFHGPVFQVLGDTLAYHRRALRVQVASGADRAACAPLLAGMGIPFALEAALHAAGVMCLLQVWQREFFLPHRIDTVLLDLAALQRAAPAKATVEFLGATVETSGPMPLRHVRCHVFLADATGSPIGALLGLQMVGGPDAPADPRTLVTSGVPFQVGGWPFMGVLVADVAPWLDDPDQLARVLSPAERSRIREFPVDKRRLDWLAGRVALKSLLREMVRERLGLTVPWPDLTIVSEQAAPRVIPGLGCDPRVAAFLKDQVFSIAHGGGLAVATAAPHPIGIDVEPLAPLAAGVADRFLTSAERAGVPASEWLALWTAKEAAAKALGLGFGVGDFTRLEATGIVYNEPYTMRVVGRSSPLTCLTFRDREFVVSLAWANPGVDRSG
jgi:acyl transferase domain-containing protein/4'-phosphopantetheinyl transferase EntD